MTQKSEPFEPDEVALTWSLLVILAAASSGSGYLHYQFKSLPDFPWRYFLPADAATFAASVALGFLNMLILDRPWARWKRYLFSLLAMSVGIVLMLWIRVSIEHAIFGKMLDSSSLPALTGFTGGNMLFFARRKRNGPALH